MSLCINPQCSQPQNPDNVLFCQTCGSELLLEGRYRVLSILGGGGFGKTFAVSDAYTQTSKVLKVLINNHPKAVELFQREAEVLTRLQHPGIPKVEANGYFVYFPRNSQEPIHCLVMEKIEGLDLCEYLRQRDNRPIDQKLALQWLKEVVTILQQVHQQDLFHRDIKPSNIMLRADGRLALIDFGTARAVTGTYIAKQAIGQVTGVISAGYTPSEQVNGQAVQQSDFFALGRTFVYLLTGQEPSHPKIYNSYTDELNWRDYLKQSKTHPTNISPQFADLLDQMMARLPHQRPQNTQVILQRLAEIDQVTQPFPPPPPPPPPPKPKAWTRRRIFKIVGFSTLGLAGAAVLSQLLPKSTLVVSKLGGGDYKTITEAINNAQPGTRILVRPGVYQESLVVDKKLTIVGDGAKAEIIVESTDASCLLMQTDNAEVRGLTLRCRAGEQNQQYFAVNIPQGQAILADCDITSDSLSSVAIHGSTANPTIQQCQIHDSKQSGIYIYDNGRGIIEDCDIFRNTTTEITIDTNAQPVIRRCKIHDGKEGGLLIRERGLGTVEDCEIFNNTLSGIEIKEDSNPTIQRCKIYDSKQGGGLLIHKKGRGTIEDCDIYNNALSGVEIREGGNPLIRQCRINKNKYNALYVHENGLGTVENSDLTGNLRQTINIDSTSQLQRSGNVE